MGNSKFPKSALPTRSNKDDPEEKEDHKKTPDSPSLSLKLTSFLLPSDYVDIALTSPSTMNPSQNNKSGYVSISTLLKKLATQSSASKVSAEEIAAAISLIFTNSLSPVQFGVLLWALHTTNLDHQAEVLAACATSMREAAAQIDETALLEVVQRRGKAEGGYGGRLVCLKSLFNAILFVKSY